MFFCEIQFYSVDFKRNYTTYNIVFVIERLIIEVQNKKVKGLRKMKILLGIVFIILASVFTGFVSFGAFGYGVWQGILVTLGTVLVMLMLSGGVFVYLTLIDSK